jgi:hypothetical protein
MPSVHVLVDLENNQPTLDDVRRLVPDLTDVWLFHSPRQVAHLSSFAALGPRHTPVPLARPGRNALDFQLAFYVGYLAARNPGAKLVVVAIDNDYAPMIEHANELKFDVTKVAFKRSSAPGSKKISGKKVAAKKKPAAKKAQAKRPPAKKVVVKKAVAKKSADAPKPLEAKPQAAKAKGAAPVKATPSKKALTKATSVKAAARPKTAAAKAAPKKAAPTKSAPARAEPKINPAGPPPRRTAFAPSGPQVGVDKVVANLRKMGDRRPKKLKQLQRHLKSLLGHDATDDSVQSLLANLLAADAVRVSEDAVDYTPLVTVSGT